MFEPVLDRRQTAQGLGKFLDDLSKDRSLGGRNPFEIEPLRLDARELEKSLVKRQALGRPMIATNIVAVAHVSAKHHHPIGALLEGTKN